MKESWKNNGFVDEPVPAGIDLKSEIRRMCQEKNAVILAHYYTAGEIQDVADFVGDSLALAQQAAKTTADVIVMCGVHFMAETNKVLCPDKKVLLPDLNAGCSLADTCKAEDLAQYKKEHPEYKVVKINVDEEPELARQYGIMTIPTLMVIKDGEVVKQSAGAKSKAQILDML